MRKLKFLVLVFLFFACLSQVVAAPIQLNDARNKSIKAGLSSEANKGRDITDVIVRAHELIGTPYRFGGASVDKGFDCSGLLYYLFRSEIGIRIPRTTTSMLHSKAKTVRRNKLKKGDAVFFKHNGRGRIKHVGVYIGNNKFIHSPRKGKTIRIDSLSNKYWSRNYLSAKRFY